MATKCKRKVRPSILLWPAEAAKLLGVSEKSLEVATRKGQIPSVTLLGNRRYFRVEIEKIRRAAK